MLLNSKNKDPKRLIKHWIQLPSGLNPIKCAHQHLHLQYLAHMYSRSESSIIRQEFWTAFGKYMSPVPSAEGLKINWINYHTRIRDIHFRMDAGSTTASIAITIEQRDPEIRELFFAQFSELKDLLHHMIEEEWVWQQHTTLPDGRTISRISKELPNVSIFNKDQWPDLISFFKPRIVALDRFWEHARYSFEELT